MRCLWNLVYCKILKWRQRSITGVKLIGLRYPTNVHIFILGSCNVHSFMNFWLIMWENLRWQNAYWIVSKFLSPNLTRWSCFFGLKHFETIHHVLCHHNSSHMLNEMFVKLSILRESNMKMCTLVWWPWPLTYDLENNKISWRSISPISKPYFVKKSSNGEFLCLNAHNCTLEWGYAMLCVALLKC
jgi:hypothetical protein